MMKPEVNTTCRRDFLKNTGRAVAASALAGVVVLPVHAAENNTIQVALVGCGGRGSGAAGDALRTNNKGPIKLVALANVFENRLDSSHRNLHNLYGRCVTGCHTEMTGQAFGAKGVAVIDDGGHHPGKCRIYRGQAMTKDKLAWAFPQPEPSPYACEWEDLIDAIRRDKPHNEARSGAEASLVTSMGRMAAHTGQVVTFEQMLNRQHEFAPAVDKLTMDSPAPLLVGPDGKYPVPQPGIVRQREY